MADNIITWNMPNWVTVVLMVVGAFLIFGMVTKLIKTRGGAAA